MRPSEGEFAVLSLVHPCEYIQGWKLSGNASGVKARKHPAQIDSLSHALRQAGHAFTAWDYIRRKDLCSVRAMTSTEQSSSNEIEISFFFMFDLDSLF